MKPNVTPTLGTVRAAPAPSSNTTPAAGGATDIVGWSTLFAGEPELVLALLEALADGPRHQKYALLAAVSRATLEHPDSAELHYYAARIAADLEEWDVAGTRLSRALALRPRYREALLLAARVAHAQHRPLAALTPLEQLLASGADFPDVHALHGDLLAATGRVAAARAAYRRSLELNPAMPGVHHKLQALIVEQAGRKH